MISLLSGNVLWCGDGVVVIDVNGVGFEVTVTDAAVRELAGTDTPVKIHTHLVVRDGEPVLFGFLTRSEVEMFLLLIQVNRVGPGLAMRILSQISIPDLAGAILDGDEAVLSRISGIGSKSAKRLILELGDKMKKRAALFVTGLSSGGDPVRRDAESALVALGFSQKEAVASVDTVLRGSSRSADISSVVRAALSLLREGS
ncbi:MAG: Holliday junction branch migration protein RuvA [Methanoregulaceae archaeon]|jgi:Holliday junction DNA helicase RuvA|nr:Holliday junction branch migration protein RuvA [Methanoregulaceae archaeon]